MLGIVLHKYPLSESPSWKTLHTSKLPLTCYRDVHEVLCDAGDTFTQVPLVDVPRGRLYKIHFTFPLTLVTGIYMDCLVRLVIYLHKYPLSESPS